MTCKSYFANLSTLLRLYPQLVFLYRPNADPIISQLALAGPGLLCSAVSPFLELFCPKFCPEIIGQLPRLLGLSREGIPSASTKASGDILPCCYYSAVLLTCAHPNLTLMLLWTFWSGGEVAATCPVTRRYGLGMRLLMPFTVTSTRLTEGF